MIRRCNVTFWLCRGRINGGGDINSLGLLPDKLKTELALHVNLETLRKVTFTTLFFGDFCGYWRMMHRQEFRLKRADAPPHALACVRGV